MGDAGDHRLLWSLVALTDARKREGECFATTIVPCLLCLLSECLRSPVLPFPSLSLGVLCRVFLPLPSSLAMVPLFSYVFALLFRSVSFFYSFASYMNTHDRLSFSPPISLLSTKGGKVNYDLPRLGLPPQDSAAVQQAVAAAATVVPPQLS